MHRWPDGTRPVSRDLLGDHVAEVAPRLLNKLLASADGRLGRIVEVEAYAGPEDPAAHSFRGPTARNASMFGPAGHLYVYLSHGIHHCANIVCAGAGHGVLVRALHPLAGLDRMRGQRPGCLRDRDLCRGPGRLARAMAIDRRHDGLDLLDGSGPYQLLDDGMPPPPAPLATPRIGISKASERPWRWLVAGDPCVSRGSPAAPRSPSRSTASGTEPQPRRRKSSPPSSA